MSPNVPTVVSGGWPTIRRSKNNTSPVVTTGRRKRGVLHRFVALGLVIGAAAMFAILVPSAQTFLRDSFTELPTAYTELYFTSDPTLTTGQNREGVSARVTIVRHGTGNAINETLVTTLNSSVAPVMKRTYVTSAAIDHPSIVDISQPAPTSSGPTLLTVSLAGSRVSVHYQISRPSNTGQVP